MEHLPLKFLVTCLRKWLLLSVFQARNNGNYYVPGEAKLAFVIRIRGINQVSPKVSVKNIFGILHNHMLLYSYKASNVIRDSYI